MFRFIALLLVASAAFVTPVQAAPPSLRDSEAREVWRFIYGKCTDKRVSSLVLLDRMKALEKARNLGLERVRVLDLEAPVDFAVDPGRLTLVVTPTGIVTRAFCR